jgi:hypothetical protein
MTDNRLFWFSSYDLEPLAAQSPACGGPQTWEESEGRILQIAEAFRKRGLQRGCLMSPTPEAAKVHADLLRGLAAEGFLFSIQPNVPAFRFPTYDRDLGQYPADEQREIIRAARGDWEDALGMTTTTYTPCCGSQSNDTPRILAELGFRQMRMPGPGRFDPRRADRCSVGLFPAPFHASARHRFVPGDLDLYVFPAVSDKTGVHYRKPGYPADLRGEAPVGEGTRARYRDIADNHIRLLLMLDAPVKYIQSGGHNTARLNIENVEYVLDYLPEAAAAFGLVLTPMGPEQVHAEADRIGAF